MTLNSMNHRKVEFSLIKIVTQNPNGCVLKNYIKTIKTLNLVRYLSTVQIYIVVVYLKKFTYFVAKIDTQFDCIVLGTQFQPLDSPFEGTGTF